MQKSDLFYLEVVINKSLKYDVMLASSAAVNIFADTCVAILCKSVYYSGRYRIKCKWAFSELSIYSHKYKIHFALLHSSDEINSFS